MNLKKTFFSVMAAGAMLAGSLGGAVAQDSDTAQGQAQVNTAGTFNVYICHSNATQNNLINFGTGTISSENPTVTLESQLVICYTDTQADRDAFRTHLKSSNFYKEGNSAHQIDKSNLKPTMIYNVGQGQWGAGVGNIGGRTSSGSAVNSNTGDQPWGDLDFGTGSLYVGYGNSGIGTGSDHYRTDANPVHSYDARSEKGSWAPIDMELTIPSTTVQGKYLNTFTVDVTFTTP